MNELIKKFLGESYSWDESGNELNYRGHPLSYQNYSAHEKAMVDKAEQAHKAEQAYNQDLRLRLMNGQVGSGMTFRG